MSRISKTITVSSVCVLLAACSGGNGGDSGSTAGVSTGAGSSQGAVPAEAAAGSKTGSGASTGAAGNSAGAGSPSGIASSPSGGSQALTGNAVDTTARFNGPDDLAIGTAGSLYVMDKGNERIRRIAATGDVSTVPADFSFSYYDEIATDAAGNLTALFNTDIYRVASNGSRSLVASYPQQPGSYLPISISTGLLGRTHVLLRYRNLLRVNELGGIGAERTVFSFQTPGSATRIAIDAQGNLAMGVYGPMKGMDAVLIIPRSIQPADANTVGVIRLPVAGIINNLIYDAIGNLYVVCLDVAVTSTFPSLYRVFDMRVLQVAPDGAVTTIARGLPDGSTSDTKATLVVNEQIGLAVDAAGTVYLSNPFNHAIYRLGSSGEYTLIAGKPGEAGDSD